MTPSIPASIVNGRARSDPGLDSCPPTAGRLAVPPEDRATGDEQDRATPSRPGYSGLACRPGATHPTSGTGEVTAAPPVPPTATLDPRDRFILLLLYGEGWSVAEVAAHLGWSGVNVKVRAHRARKRLKHLLEKAAP